MQIQKWPLKVFEDDTFLVSYPKSGNTWMRFLIGTLYFGYKIDWLNVEDRLPDSYGAENVLLNAPEPRIIKSHEPYDDRYRKVIYIARDVREVVISYYYHHLRYREKPDNLRFDDFFNCFTAGEVGPGLWDQHVLSWIDQQHKVKNGFLLIKYEDLMRDIFGEAAKIVRFLDLKRTDTEIKEAIEWSSFSNMRSLEIKQCENLNMKIPFVRQGQINTWKSFLTEEQQNEMKRSFGGTLSRLGYTE